MTWQFCSTKEAKCLEDKLINTLYWRKFNGLTLSNPSSSIKPIIMGIAVKTPIWTKNCALRAASRAVFPIFFALTDIALSSPEKAWKSWRNQKMSLSKWENRLIKVVHKRPSTYEKQFDRQYKKRPRSSSWLGNIIEYAHRTRRITKILETKWEVYNPISQWKA